MPRSREKLELDDSNMLLLFSIVLEHTKSKCLVKLFKVYSSSLLITEWQLLKK